MGTHATSFIACVSLRQVADGMEIGKEDSDEEKVAALSAVVAVGETVYVKVVEIKGDDGSGRCKLPQPSRVGGTLRGVGGWVRSGRVVACGEFLLLCKHA